MRNPDQRTVFAGVDARSEAPLPEWYAQYHQARDPVTFAKAIRRLPSATDAKVAFYNPFVDDWVETERFSAVVEPTRLREADEDPLFHIPTDRYTIINPLEAYGPLEAVLREETYDEVPLGDLVFGEVREYRRGGEVHLDLLFDEFAVDLPTHGEAITMGLASGYDFFGSHAVYAEGIARDGVCANSIRALTDRETVRHVGETGTFSEWWLARLEALELLVDELHMAIEAAQAVVVDFTQVDYDLEGFFALLGFPDYLATHAAGDALANATDPLRIDGWTLHSGATYALTHHFTGREGAAFDAYVRAANDLLFNPSVAVEEVEIAAKTVAADGEAPTAARVAIERAEPSLAEKAGQFRSREATLEAWLAPE